MSTETRTRASLESASKADELRTNGHVLIAIDEWLPGKEPTDYDVDLSGSEEYVTRYWRCRNCGQERNRRSEFSEYCSIETSRNPIADGGYTLEEPRTRRALLEQMDVRYGIRGSAYEVDSESGATYEVDVTAKECTCPDHVSRGVECKHLRRVQLEILAGKIPNPDGRFVR